MAKKCPSCREFGECDCECHKSAGVIMDGQPTTKDGVEAAREWMRGRYEQVRTHGDFVKFTHSTDGLAEVLAAYTSTLTTRISELEKGMKEVVQLLRDEGGFEELEYRLREMLGEK